MKKTLIPTLAALLLALLLTRALAAEPGRPQLQRLKHTVVSPSMEQVVLQLNGSYSPKVFTLKDETPRIVFDFAGMTHGREIKGVTTTNGTLVKRIRVGMQTQGAIKTRIVFDMATLKGVTYSQQFDQGASTLTVSITGPPQTVAADNEAKKVTDKDKVADKDKKPARTTTPATKTAEPLTMVTAQPPPAPPKAAAETKPALKPETVPSEAKTGSPAKETSPLTGDKAVDKTVDKAAATKPPTASPPPAQPEATAETKPALKPETVPSEAKTGSPAKEAPPPPVDTPDKAVGKKTPPAGATPPPPTQPESAAAQTGAKTATDKGTATKPDLLAKPESGPQLESIKFDGTSPKGEMVLFKLNDFYPPVIHGVEEGVPRVICDFNNTKLVYAGKNLVKANGKFVKLIRITRNKNPERVRVVLDLEPNQSYDLQQVFFKEDNLFVIIVNTVKK